MSRWTARYAASENRRRMAHLGARSHGEQFLRLPAGVLLPRCFACGSERLCAHRDPALVALAVERFVGTFRRVDELATALVQRSESRKMVDHGCHVG